LLERSISIRHATLPSASPFAWSTIAATPSSAAQRPGWIGPGLNPRVVRPGTWPRGRARYSSSEEKPCGVIVTSGCDEPPQPRKSSTSHVTTDPDGGS
jgi:hypothetical protein